jgi:hypothetical protein|tara:strand:+ start:2355 stop:2678 length:324 start_codon:yes stop_codon:yes gene_type:complete
MTTKKDATLELENVPVPQDFFINRERLPENILETLQKMAVGKSFFIFTDNAHHTKRKISALRSCISRHRQNFPQHQFSVRKERKAGKRGVRVYKMEDDRGMEDDYGD